MSRILAIIAAMFAFFAASVGTAHADEQSYLANLAVHGMTYGAPVTGIASPAMALRAGQDICNNIRYDGNPRAGFNMLTNASIPDYMIEAAQHELCPDTLTAGAGAPVPPPAEPANGPGNPG